MNRRTVLATIGGVSALSFAGCASVGGSTVLANPTEEVEADGETHLSFETDGDRLATLTVQPPNHGSIPIPVDVSIGHRETTTITDLEHNLRAPPGGSGVPAQIALTAPQWQPHPPVQLYNSQDGGTVLDIDDMDEQGEGTVSFEFFVAPVEDVPSELLVEATIGLTERGVLGRQYTARARTRVRLPTDGDE